jgi:AraC-like DNA-binding protein
MDYHSKVHDSLGYIEENLDDRINLDDLAQKAYLSKYHYHRLFHKITGESVTKYITKRRMAKASEELVQTDQPIIDIALKYQYASQEAFSRAFVRVYGLMPGKYRRVYGSSKFNNVIRLNSYFNKITNMAA